MACFLEGRMPSMMFHLGIFFRPELPGTSSYLRHLECCEVWPFVLIRQRLQCMTTDEVFRFGHVHSRLHYRHYDASFFSSRHIVLEIFYLSCPPEVFGYDLMGDVSRHGGVSRF